MSEFCVVPASVVFLCDLLPGSRKRQKTGGFVNISLLWFIRCVMYNSIQFTWIRSNEVHRVQCVDIEKCAIGWGNMAKGEKITTIIVVVCVGVDNIYNNNTIKLVHFKQSWVFFIYFYRKLSRRVVRMKAVCAVEMSVQTFSLHKSQEQCRHGRKRKANQAICKCQLYYIRYREWLIWFYLSPLKMFVHFSVGSVKVFKEQSVPTSDRFQLCQFNQ